MFDVGFFELVLVAVVGLLVLGPERLPHAMRMTGAAIGKVRRTIIGFKSDLEREVELDALKKRLADYTNDQEGTDTIGQLKQLRQELESIETTDTPSEPQTHSESVAHSNLDPTTNQAKPNEPPKPSQ